jgi:hypothetical protein
MGALVATLGACGSVPMDDGPDAAPDGPGMTRTYRGSLEMSPVSLFNSTECDYSMTLRQIQLQLTASATGEVTGGTLQNTTEEKVINVVRMCPYLPANPTTMRFTFKSATPVGASTMIVMEGDAANAPKATLAITLSPTGTGYTAGARWTRTDLTGTLNWVVTANLPVTVQ